MRIGGEIFVGSMGWTGGVGLGEFCFKLSLYKYKQAGDWMWEIFSRHRTLNTGHVGVVITVRSNPYPLSRNNSIHLVHAQSLVWLWPLPTAKTGAASVLPRT
jgi:hypothetical protein